MIAQLRSGGWRLRLLLVNEWDSKASARSLARQLEGRSWTLNVVFSGSVGALERRIGAGNRPPTA